MRRSAGSLTPGGSNLVAPSASSVVRLSTVRHCVVSVRFSPLGKVTENTGA